MVHKITIERLITVGIPLLVSVVGLILGYDADKETFYKIPLQIIGWGSANLTIIFIYLEYQFSKEKIKPYETLQKRGDPIKIIIKILEDVQPGDEIYSIDTVQSYPDYEKAYINAVKKACSTKEDTGFICLRIISNQSKRCEMREMYKNMTEYNDIYAPLKEYDKKIKVIKMDKPIGIDPLLIAKEKSKIALLGIKEAGPNSYFNGFRGKHINHGKTYIFENDDIAESIYNYFLNFISEES